jgi:transcription antitermination factor NusG
VRAGDAPPADLVFEPRPADWTFVESEVPYQGQSSPPPRAVDVEPLLPQRRRDGGRSWFVLHTRARQEKALRAALDGLGIASYVPLRHVERRHGRRRVESDLPLFPSYVFMWGDTEETRLAESTHRVATVLAVQDPLRLEWELTNLNRALTRRAPLESCNPLRDGMFVRVASGRFEGLEGVVGDLVAPEHLLLQVRMLNAATCLCIHGEHIELLL